VIVGVSR